MYNKCAINVNYKKSECKHTKSLELLSSYRLETVTDSESRVLTSIRCSLDFRVDRNRRVVDLNVLCPVSFFWREFECVSSASFLNSSSSSASSVISPSSANSPLIAAMVSEKSSLTFLDLRGNIRLLRGIFTVWHIRCVAASRCFFSSAALNALF